MAVARLGTSRPVVVISSGGKIIASRINGMPSTCGLRNWSKKFRFMVSLTRLLWGPIGRALRGC